MAIKKSIYIETTIPSYATARDSNNALNVVRKTQTNDFWDNHRHKFRVVVGEPTWDECAAGDPIAAKRRLDFIKELELLKLTDKAKELAAEYMGFLKIPEDAKVDCDHLAICVLNQIDYLLSWNMGHLGNETWQKANNFNSKHGLSTPILLTPENIFMHIRRQEAENA